MSVGVGPRPLGVGRFVPGSVIKFCRIKCRIKHCQELCFSPDPGLYRFGEGFCGARAPLTWAHCCDGIQVIAPFDEL